MSMPTRALVVGVGLSVLTGVLVGQRAPETGLRGNADWTVYGGPLGMRYSPLSQITLDNVASLRVAWSFDTGETGGLQTQPLVVGGVLYANTPSQKVVAIDAATGEKRWTFDSGLTDRSPNRGVAYWSDGREARIFASVSSYLYALDASTGQPVPAFGTSGRVDLRDGLGRDPQTLSVGLSTPGVVYKDLLIIGSRTSERLPAAPGDIRAYDTRTGTLRWSFHTIPHPGEFGYDTWPKDAWLRSGSANAWAGLTLDADRGVVYVPTGSAAFDFYGGDRAGDNLFANTVLALDATTGTRLWHFQGVHHDIWDRDFSAPPTLVTVERNGRLVDGLVQANKHGVLFALDRTTGKPLFPIEERPVPPSTVPGEVASPTQPVPTLPEPVLPQAITPDLLTTRTPEAHAWAVKALSEMQTGPFAPMAIGKNTLVSPGWDGGVEWGGLAFDPGTRRLYVNASNMPEYTSLVENSAPTADARGLYTSLCASCHKADFSGSPPQVPTLVDVERRRSLEEIDALIRQGSSQMPGFAGLAPEARSAIVEYVLRGRNQSIDGGGAAATGARGRGAAISGTVADRYRFTGYNRFVDPDGYPAVATPWGTLNAIDMDTGRYVWRIPLGQYPELAAQGLTDTGSENYGGPIVTAGGLVFIGATLHDKKFRAFDASTGKLVWETTLPFAGTATPITYEAGGRQFVVIAAGGRRLQPTGGVYVAFALP
jgi:quinoprotein glucose dehydrogenase